MKSFTFAPIAPVLLAAASVLLASGFGGPANAADIGADGLSGSLVSLMADSSADVPDFATSPTSSQGRTVRVSSPARRSVPARDRSASLRDADLFRNSKVAVPLLVIDLEARSTSGIRPMSGRSVGARPTTVPPFRE